MGKVEYFEHERVESKEITEGADIQSKFVFELISKGFATFLRYGLDYQECEQGVGTYSTAIIKLDDGTVKNVPVEQIKFIE